MEKKVLFTATVDSHILHFHIPYLKLFKDNGYEVHVATNGNEDIPYCDKKHVISFERSPYKINNLKAIRQLRKIINEEGFDIIHCHTPMGSVVTRLAAKSARKKGTRIIYTAHGFHFYKGAPKLNWFLFYPVEKYLSKYTDTLITINKEDYDLAKRKFRKCNDIKYVPGVGIDEKKFDFKMSKKERDDLRKSLGLKSDDFVMIQVGELNKNKNQIMSINAMKKITNEYNNIHLLLVGDGSMKDYYNIQIKNNNLENNVHLLGYRSDVSKLLKVSDILLSLSYREGLPVNVIEAEFCGLPIIATNCRGNRDLVKNNKNGYLVNLDDDESFRKRIEELYKNKEKYKTFKECSKKEVKQYMLENILESMKKIYFRKNKGIILLRSTSIKNDSRIQKEAKTFLETNEYVKVIGWDRKQEFNKNEIFDGIDINFFRKKSIYGSGIKNLFNILLFQIYIFFKLYEYRKKYNKIFSCDLDTGITARIFSKLFKKKFIYDIYDYYVDCHKIPSKLKNKIEKQEIKNINSADITIICTEERKKQITKAKPKKLIIVHNSPELPNFDNCKEYKLKSKTEKLKICYVGILQEDRLLIEILDVIKNNKKYELHIGGFGKYEQKIANYSKEYSNIFFYGSMNYYDVLRLERECDILFATYNPKIENHKFSAPNKLYEAMALGKPIIVCKNTGIDKLVDKNKLGIVINYDSKEFLRAIKSLEKNTNYESSKLLYNNKYSWNVMKEKLKKL